MAEGFIRLDNPSFRGNLRAYRKRTNQTGYLSRTSVRLVSDFVGPTYRSRNLEPMPSPKRSLQAQARPRPLETPQPIAAPQKAKQASGQQATQPATVVKQGKKRLAKLRRNFRWFASKTPRPVRRAVRKLMAVQQKLPVPNYALPALAVALFLVGTGVVIRGLQANQAVQAQTEQLTGEDSFQGEGDVRDVPDETRPDPRTFGSYIVAPDLPRFLRIPRFNILARVMREGVLPNGEVDTPRNIFDVGWYEGSAKPGDIGATLIVGHLSGPTTNGSLYNLKDLNTGDTVEIERGDGKKLTYAVVGKKTQNYQDVDMAKALRSQDPTKSGLNLITCAGRYDARRHVFEKRIVVYTVLQ